MYYLIYCNSVICLCIYFIYMEIVKSCLLLCYIIIIIYCKAGAPPVRAQGGRLACLDIRPVWLLRYESCQAGKF